MAKPCAVRMGGQVGSGVGESNRFRPQKDRKDSKRSGFMKQKSHFPK
jgi:hypothetical protein